MSYVLATFSGRDKPGITSAMTKILAEAEVTIVDIGQAVIHELLSLSILFSMNDTDGRGVIKDLLFEANELGMKLDFQILKEEDIPQRHLTEKAIRYVVTILAERIGAEALHAVTQIVSKSGFNIDTIQRLSEGEFACVEMIISSDKEISRVNLKKELLEISFKSQVDVALQEDGPFRRMKRLIAFDMDSTLIQNEIIDELAKERGVFDKVGTITEQAMQGKIDFQESLRQRTALLAGLTPEDLRKVADRIQITPGAKELTGMLKKLGYKIALISGGFTHFAEKLRSELQLDYVYANELETTNGILTGQVKSPIIDAQRKADLLEVIAQNERISLDQVIAVGDGANDLKMLEKAGLGIAFNAKPVVRESADLSYNQKNLRSILHLLGFRTAEINRFI
jgi:phosphoserine phosphatase